ncbi:Integrase zinc-binding domain [Dillenia turbinata]|uniref:Integrase zinc-binding domain n=1 Tax=Dillenia turbinata TaxID=194707 RepID=A0AAN8UMH9_9MAGN
MQRLHKLFQEGDLLGPWACKDGLLFYKEQIYLLPSSPLTTNVIQGFHSATHERLHKTLQCIRSQFYWRGMKKQATYDKGRKELRFEVGDRVYLKLQPYRQHSLSGDRRHKLSARYFGPYKIIEPIEPVAYRLLLPEGSKVHPVVHVSLIKKQLKNHSIVENTLPDVGDEVDMNKRFFTSRTIPRRGRGRLRARQRQAHNRESEREGLSEVLNCKKLES